MKDKEETNTILESSEDKLKVSDKVGDEKVKVVRKRSHSRRRQRGSYEESINDASYFFRDGLRFVNPYRFEYYVDVKEKWSNMTILDLYCNKFPEKAMEYYEEAIKTGKIKVNDQMVSSDRVLKVDETVSSLVHRHEPPVMHQEIEIIENNDNRIVVNKPPSIPVYPSGKYRCNSITVIIGKEYNLNELIALNKIERCISGIVILAKSQNKGRKMAKMMRQMEVKEYFARVVGEFPSGEMICKAPILLASQNYGVNLVHSDGQPASTSFKLISYNGKSSLVSCKPETNVMHQIRVHLQHLGHPIINDPIYNHPTAWVKHNGKYNIDEVVQELLRTRDDKMHNGAVKTGELDSNGSQIRSDSLSEENVVCHKKIKLDDGTDSRFSDEATDTEKEDVYDASIFSEQYIDEDCTDCKRQWKLPSESELFMYLHFFYCKCPSFEYKTSKPSWALEGWDSC